MKSLIIDNYDSFTYNIYQLLAEVNDIKPIVIKNNELSWQEIQNFDFDNIIISPGPGNPKNREDFGICREVLLNSNIPVLGICLGHQGLGYFYGAKVKKSIEPFHGRISQIYHEQNSLFFNIPSPFKVVRYHSLIIDYPLSSDLEIIAKTEDNLIMGIKHKFKPFWGVQFHPESICSEYGKELFINFQNLTKNYYKNFSQSQIIKTRSSFLTNSNNVKKHNYQENKTNIKQNKEYKVYSKKLDIFLDSAQVFKEIYSKSSHSFWLDSSMIEEGLSRFSYMGDGEGNNSFLIEYDVNRQEIKVKKKNKIEILNGDIFPFLQNILDKYIYENKDLPFNFNAGLVGYLAYELKALCGHQNKHKSCFPDAQFIFVDRAIIFDHIDQEIYLIFFDKINQETNANNWFKDIEKQLNLLTNKKISYKKINQNNYQLSRDEKKYLENIETCLEKIKEGESYEICLTNHLHLSTIKEPLNYYLQLRKKNPVPYSAFFQWDKMTVVCSSPERFLLLGKDGILESKPIKGTVKRGRNKEEDIQFKNNLQISEKEKAENLMIVDLLRNDLGRVCETGTITVPKLMSIESYSTVHQMVSTVKGKIRKGIKPVDCIKACFPGGSMTGAPKKRTLEIIDELETEARGIYSGSIGFLALNGTMDLNIVIRTAIITPHQTSIGVGGAITILSEKDKEFEEIILKAKALLESL
ncbi:aminodeoxychorismate synthase [Geminocystis sp. NIES-3709]|uniref:aminodeoxychorismate synthase n=1 Tax=Geminocystis sp. NIES-3709 TaxID=1617448 RepID=UPI0005FC42F4|nr:aminodeoxychorismate synthase [Geminocystis sp. NIES-3709]BAQ65633.1 para-aminobenzoate synthase [Geminocystis sp. NIES-3709]